MRVNVRVEVNTTAKEFTQRADDFINDFLKNLAELTRDIAKENVAPGKGPGPHPHRPGSHHVDTGRLRESIQVAYQERGFLKTAVVYTDLEYGLYLEAGWTTSKGNHFRYPWLTPAAEMARQRTRDIARSTYRRWMSEAGSSYKGRKDITSLLAATWQPEPG